MPESTLSCSTVAGQSDRFCSRLHGQQYARKDKLMQKKIVSRATYEQIKYKIVAKQNRGKIALNLLP